MRDLETMLRVDAAADDVPDADLDAMMTVAQRRAGRQWVPVVAAAVAVTLVVGLALLIKGVGFDSDGPRPASTNPAGPGDPARTSLIGAVVPPGKSHQLIVWVQVHASGYPCRGNVQKALRLRESTSRIELRDPTDLLVEPQGRHLDRDCQRGAYYPVEVDLSGAMTKDRIVVDQASGTRVPVLYAADVPDLPTVPTGFVRLRPPKPVSDDPCTGCDGYTAPTHRVGFDTEQPPPWALKVWFQYQQRAPGGVPRSLTVTDGLGRYVPDGTTIAHVRVGPHSAAVDESQIHNSRCISWSPSRGRWRSVCMNVYGTNPKKYVPHLYTVDQLVQVAGSVD